MSVFKEVGNNREYRDEYYLYSRLENQSYQKYDSEPTAKFKACDAIDYYEDRQTDSVSLRTVKHLTIKTPTRLNFHPGDKLEGIKDNSTWVISKVTIADDNKCKDKSLRPKKITFLELVG